uniref:Uncharacterized protein n=1 Tax=Glossina pallidipes TaxID=7398 RepID=A0A1A9ZG67_GLOPL
MNTTPTRSRELLQYFVKIADLFITLLVVALTSALDDRDLFEDLYLIGSLQKQKCSNFMITGLWPTQTSKERKSNLDSRNSPSSPSRGDCKGKVGWTTLSFNGTQALRNTRSLTTVQERLKHSDNVDSGHLKYFKN